MDILTLRFLRMITKNNSLINHTQSRNEAKTKEIGKKKSLKTGGDNEKPQKKQKYLTIS